MENDNDKSNNNDNTSLCTDFTAIIYLSIWLFIYISIYLFIYLFIYIFVFTTENTYQLILLNVPHDLGSNHY